MSRKILLAGIIALIFSYTFSQDKGYHIAVNISDYTDSVAYLGHYYADKLSVADTAFSDNGKFVYTGHEPLKQGVYFVVSMDKRKLFEFIVDNDQHFSISSTMQAPPDEVVIKGSDENELFYTYLSHNRKSYERMRNIRNRIKALEAGSDSLKYYREEIGRLNQSSIDYKIQFMEDHPESMTSLLFTLMKEPEMPDFFLEDGRHDTLSAYLYYRKHYWENIDLSDDRILRTPVFYRKLNTYMEQVIPKHPDSVIVEIDRMIAATHNNKDMKEFMLWHFTNTYETSKVMGYDRIFVHMVDEYFTDTSYDWLHHEVQQNMINRANTLRQVLIDAYAPALIMVDTNGQFVALRQIEAEYIIVLFWVSHCGECQREVNALKKFYQETDIDLEVYAVNTDTSMHEWKSYIVRKGLDWVHVNGNYSLTGDYHDLYDIYSTPVIYVLDRNKKIIAKRLAADRIPEFIYRHRKLKYENN